MGSYNWYPSYEGMSTVRDAQKQYETLMPWEDQPPLGSQLGNALLALAREYHIDPRDVTCISIDFV